MNMVPSEAAKYAASLAAAAKDAKVKVMIAPTFVCLPGVVEAVKGSNIIVSAQNVNDHEKGAYTGEVSCAMLKDIGVNSVILGHSERRQYYGETNEFINKKVLFALENGMEVDLCVGETLEEREIILKTAIFLPTPTGFSSINAVDDWEELLKCQRRPTNKRTVYVFAGHELADVGRLH